MFAQVFLVGLLSGISPGPDFAVVMRNSLCNGRKTGMASALGIGTALGIHVTYTVLGFAVVLQHSPVLFRLIQLLGAAYLIWLGQRAFRTKKSNHGLDGVVCHPVGDRSFRVGFRDGFICNILNPKAALFFLSIFSQFLTPETPAWVQWVYGAEIMVAVGGWFVLLSIMISSRRFRDLYGAYSYWIDRALGTILLFFGLRIVVGLFLR